MTHPSPDRSKRASCLGPPGGAYAYLRQPAAGAKDYAVPTKTQRILGWVITVLVALAFLASAAGKFSGAEGVQKNFAALGIDFDKASTIGAIEVVCALVYLVPQAAFLGAILLTGYAGGAVFAHSRAGVPTPLIPFALGVLAWVGYGLRNPRIIRAAFGRWT